MAEVEGLGWRGGGGWKESSIASPCGDWLLPRPLNTHATCTSPRILPTEQHQQRDGCPKIINLGSAKTE